MAKESPRRKYGIVVLLDALGASTFTESQIRRFLAARSDINAFAKDFPSFIKRGGVKGLGTFPPPAVFTFGDTVIITIPLRSKKYIDTHISLTAMLMRRYLFHSFEEGIMFRGSFSIGYYLEDSQSNTVMGPSVTDAAAWYDQSEWMGLSSTPKTNSVLEYLASSSEPGEDLFYYMVRYSVPLKSGETFGLYAIDWPSAFLEKDLVPKAHQKNPPKYFLDCLQNFSVPKGTEMIFENTKEYFSGMVGGKPTRRIQPTQKNRSPLMLGVENCEDINEGEIGFIAN
jgi:hypothetical protein